MEGIYGELCAVTQQNQLMMGQCGCTQHKERVRLVWAAERPSGAWERAVLRARPHLY